MIARIVLYGPSVPEYMAGRKMQSAAETLLIRTFKAWPSGYRTKFLITFGGFLEAALPPVPGCCGWSSTADDFRTIQNSAEAVLQGVVTPRVLQAAVAKADSITIGIDLNDPEGFHAELVAFVRCNDGRILRWTGKSYPTASQEKTLFQVIDLESHCVRFGGERALILGCHDLNMFSPRGRSTQRPEGNRRKRCDDFRRMTSKFHPTVVLHHPHRTDSARIWRVPWSSLVDTYDAILKHGASGICFYREDGPRDTLDNVLRNTRFRGDGVDFVFTYSSGKLLGPDVRHTRQNS